MQFQKAAKYKKFVSEILKAFNQTRIQKSATGKLLQESGGGARKQFGSVLKSFRNGSKHFVYLNQS